MNNFYNYYASAPAPAKKKGFPGWAAALIVLAVILAAAGLIWSLLLKNPLVSVERAWKTSLKAAESSEVGEIASAAADSGSVEISLDARDLTESLFGLSINAGARVKFYFDLDRSDSREAAVEAAVSLNGAEAADLLLYTDGKSAAVQSEAILGAKNYGFRFGDVRERFDSSVFGPGGAYDLGELFGLELTGEKLGELFESFAPSRGSEEEMKKVFESVSGHILKMLPEYGEITKESGTVTLLSEKEVKTQNVVIFLEGEKLADFLKAALEEIRDNERLNEYLNKHAELFEKSGKTLEDYRAALDDASNDIEEDRDEIAQYETTLVFSISKENRQLIAADLGMISKRDAEKRIDVPIRVHLTCGPDWSDPEEISFYATYDDTMTQFHCTTVKDGNGGAKTDLRAAIGDETLFDGTLTTGGEDGAFALEVSFASLGTFGLNGSCRRAEKELTVIVLDSVRLGDEEYSLGGASVTVLEKDTMPVISDYRDVLSMSEEDVGKIGEDVNEFIETFKDKLTEMLGLLAFLLF
ncbi:MAG: hypothetical protein E7576_00730 [Ruminococcaceae bacterium]|jgi:hypothetical protein|nr:hypothetical protein [Oscillospiraceae bacterium]